MSNFNAIMNSRNEVIGHTDDQGRQIEIAGAISDSGEPVNVSSYKISKSKTNKAKICAEMPTAVAHEFRGNKFFTMEG